MYLGKHYVSEALKLINLTTTSNFTKANKFSHKFQFYHKILIDFDYKNVFQFL